MIHSSGPPLAHASLIGRKSSSCFTRPKSCTCFTLQAQLAQVSLLRPNSGTCFTPHAHLWHMLHSSGPTIAQASLLGPSHAHASLLRTNSSTCFTPQAHLLHMLHSSCSTSTSFTSQDHLSPPLLPHSAPAPVKRKMN
jgi:hypothetical protein